jgi:hypothetical protein
MPLTFEEPGAAGPVAFALTASSFVIRSSSLLPLCAFTEKLQSRRIITLVKNRSANNLLIDFG